MKKAINFFALMACVFLSSQLFAQDYSKLLRDVIKKELNNDLKGFQYFESPTDNYGLITTYRKNTKNFECDMFNCIGLNQPLSTDTAWIKMNGFAAVGGNGKTITLEQNVQDELGIKFILPKIFKIVGLNSSFDKNKIADLKLTLGPIFIRELRKEPMENYLRGLPQDSRRIKLFNSGQMVLVVADCIIQSMDVELTLKDTSKTQVDAKFGWQGGTVAAQILDSAAIGIKIEKKSAGTYKFSLTHPVIFARKTAKQPKGGELGAKENPFFEDWTAIDEDAIINPEKIKRN